MHLKISFGKFRPSCVGLNVLIYSCASTYHHRRLGQIRIHTIMWLYTLRCIKNNNIDRTYCLFAVPRFIVLHAFPDIPIDDHIYVCAYPGQKQRIKQLCLLDHCSGYNTIGMHICDAQWLHQMVWYTNTTTYAFIFIHKYNVVWH